MKIGAIIQQPGEKLDYDVSYSTWFAESRDTLSGFTASVVPVGLSVSAAIKDPETGKLWVEGGEADEVYYVTLTGTTNDGRVKEDEIEFHITEVQ